MDTHQDELFQLIHALNKNEKKFFTQYVNLYEKGSNPTYLKLFHFLNDAEAYSEADVFKKFRDPQFKKTYPVTKHYLKNLIIKTLRHSDLTVREDRDLTVYILDIKRMMAKGLFGMAKKQIEKLKSEAQEDEKFQDVIHLIAMQRGLISMGYYRDQPEVNLDSLDEEEEALFDTIRELRNVMNASIKLYSLMHYEMSALPEEVMKEIESLGKKPVMQDYERLRSAKARHSFLQFWAMYYSAIGNYEKYHEYAVKKLHFVTTEKIPKTVTNWLILAYNHYLGASLLIKDFSGFEEKLKFLEKMELQSQFHDSDRFQTVSMYGMLYYIHLNDDRKLMESIEYARSGLNRLAPFIRISFSYTLRTQIAYALLKLKKYDECVDAVNELMNAAANETRKDYTGHVKIINLMLRFEMGEKQYLTYLLKNTYRFFRNYLYVTPMHKFVIAYIKDALRTRNEKQTTDLNKKYLEELASLRFDPTEADAALVLIMENYLTSRSV